MRLETLHVKLFADGASLEDIARMAALPHIQGFTTNPSLMRKAGVRDYEAFAHDALALVGGRPISFEVFADDFPTMQQQAERIASWGENVYVKIPVTTTDGRSSAALVHALTHAGVKVNVTAVFTPEQLHVVMDVLTGGSPAIVSVFAGRIADSGRSPSPIMSEGMFILRGSGITNVELLWASAREVYNVAQADKIGCHIITLTPDLLAKLPLLGKDLDEFSLETVCQFHEDALKAGYTL